MSTTPTRTRFLAAALAAALGAGGALVAAGGPEVARSQTSSFPQCDDGIDNDGDGFYDFYTESQADPGCSSASDDDENEAPLPTLDVTPSSAQSGQQVVFDASGSSDPEHQTLTYRWDLDADGTYELSTGTQPYTSKTYSGAFAGTVKVSVTDSYNASRVAARNLQVSEQPTTNRPPTAAFSASPGAPTTGSPVTFDASASTDPDGTIVRYDWDLDGDGTPEVTSATPTITRTYTQPGDVTVSLKVTDDDGAQASSISTITVRQGGGDGGGGLPAPERGETANVARVTGTIRFRPPGSRHYVLLTGAQQIPIGSMIDTRKGTIELTTASDDTGGQQTAEFFDGLFQLRQPDIDGSFTEARLAGAPACSRATASQHKAKRGRRLWGRGKGRFRTRGRRSAATVRGTFWLVYDRCNGSTYTVVRKGVVSVRDYSRGKTLTLSQEGKRRYSTKTTGPTKP